MMQHKRLVLDIPWPTEPLGWIVKLIRGWFPSRGNVLFTLLLVGGLLWAQTAGAIPAGQPAASISTIPYQGRLADAGGLPLTGTYTMVFRLYSAASGGAPLWEEPWTGPNGVQVSDGLFNVMLGSLTPIPQSAITGNNLWLGVTVGTDSEMAPRVQIGTLPFAVQALTVPDGAIITAKIADGAVTQAKLGPDVSLIPPDGSITTAKLADGAVTQAKAPGLVAGPSNNVKIAYGRVQNLGELPGRPGVGAYTVSLAGYGFTEPPIAMCSLAGGAGFDWTCSVQYETKDSFFIWVVKKDNGTNWPYPANVNWIAIGS